MGYFQDVVDETVACGVSFGRALKLSRVRMSRHPRVRSLGGLERAEEREVREWGDEVRHRRSVEKRGRMDAALEEWKLGDRREPLDLSGV